MEVHDVLSSTQDRLRSLAAEGAPAWCVVVADEQTAGRGRSGARWRSDAGHGLLMSVLVPGMPDRTRTPAVTLAVGLAVARAIAATADAQPAIKWPNDVYVEGRKVAGVLCETAGTSLIVGVGVNVRAPEGGFGSALHRIAGAVSKREGPPVSRGELAGAVLDEMRALLAERVLAGPALNELRKRDMLRGRAVRTHRGVGTGAGIGDDGALLVDLDPGGRAAVVAGSVQLLDGHNHGQ